jgi:hypothetical protein
MYLNAKRFLWHSDEELTNAISEQLPELKDLRVKEVIVEAGYWRKANAIHAWFVGKVQDGEDDCGHYPVSRVELQQLRAECRKVLDFKHLATNTLPPAAGFFFGGTDLDEWYYKGLEDTIIIIDQALALPEVWYFEYHSSW